jgi:aryl-alcohol dehydrogenase-like predicted oxidoreductase
MKILSALDEISIKYKTAPATIALAWLMTRPAVVAPIASATSVQQLEDLLKAVKIELDKESIKILSLEAEPVAS